MEPAVVKTVSYFKLSTVIVTWASGLVMNDSFLQANRKTGRVKIRKPGGIFIAIKILEEIDFSLQIYGQYAEHHSEA
jgi:hypothetical protein